jgi:hypothetical protein
MLASIAFNNRSLKSRLYRKAIRVRDFLFGTVHEAPIFVLGNQKSGTTAIALLLADASGKSVTIDLYKEIFNPEFQTLPQNLDGFGTFIKKNRVDFSRAIIKEPNLTLFYPQLQRRFPKSRFVFIVRQPHDNIRSILDNLNLRGDLDYAVDELSPNVTKAWRYVLDNRWCMATDAHYISSLCARWNYMVDVFLENQSLFKLVRYEDFKADKKDMIHQLARRLGLTIVNDISDLVSRQYQSRGANRGIDVGAFFGAHNFQMITAQCGNRMKHLGYE